MKRWLLLVALLVLCLVLPGVEADAADDVLPALVRLHVSANGESLHEQQVKIRVRDELLAYLQPVLRGVADQEQAVALIKAHLAELTTIANDVLGQQGEAYTAALQLGEFNFPAKHYGTFTLPAGRYLALNVTLGTGQGRNWWCVVFPPMCLTAEVCGNNSGTADHFVLRSFVLDCWRGLRSWFPSDAQPAQYSGSYCQT